jgi:hypothetical protein
MKKTSAWDRFRVAGPVMAMCVCALLMSRSQISATTIDHFDVTDTGLTKFIGVSEFNDSPDFFAQTASFQDIVVDPDLLGGSRKVDLSWVSGNDGGSGRAILNPANHYINFQNSEDVKSNLVLTYDGDCVSNGFADTDFTDGGSSDSILVLYLGADFGSTVIVTVYDGVKSATQTMLSPAGPSTEAFLFSGFTPSGGFTPGSWTSINKVIVEIDSVPSGDYKIDLLGTGVIPEPLTMLGVFLGLGSLGAYIRRRRMV